MALPEDFKAVAYDPKLYGADVLAKIADFNATYQRLFETDVYLGVCGAGVAAFALLISAAAIPLIAVAGAGYYCTHDTIKTRSEVRQQFLKELAELEKIYRWCIHKNVGNITQDKIFIKLLTAIAPFVKSNELVTFDGPYSVAFKRTLEQEPHRCQFSGTEIKAPTQPWFSASYWLGQSSSSDEAKSEVKEVAAHQIPGAPIGQIAKFKLWFYGKFELKTEHALPPSAAALISSLSAAKP